MMTLDIAARQDRSGDHPATPMGLAQLASMAFASADLAPLHQRLVDRVMAHPQDAAALMDLSVIKHLSGERSSGLALQARALALQRVYRWPSTDPARTGIRLLAFMVPGDFMANTPLEFLLEDSDTTLDALYVTPGQPLPDRIPDHDVAIVAVGEADANRAVLDMLTTLVQSWPRPVLNAPDRVARLSRDGAWGVLHTLPGVAMPMTVRIERQALLGIGLGIVPIEAGLDGMSFPVIARPIASHAGEGLAKLDDRAALRSYLSSRAEPEFYVAPFVDYRGPDGLFRKYRIAVIDGRPFACHMAISQHWMVHYLNAGMTESAEKRAEEARFMERFDAEFAVRHEAALRAVAERVALDYFGIDCAETPDGRLLIFEMDTAMIVHSMDPPEMFPYKRPQMLKVFGAFQTMLRGASPQAEQSPEVSPRPAAPIVDGTP